MRRVRMELRYAALPERRLRINRRELKQLSRKYKPKKRDVPPPEPFEPGERFEDFVCLFSFAEPPWRDPPSAEKEGLASYVKCIGPCARSTGVCLAECSDV